MAEDLTQLPRYTSTPLAGRKTSNIPSNYFEVSPISSTPEEVENAKSKIPVLKGGEMRPRSNGIQSIEAKKKLCSTSNSTGPGCSGLTTILQPTQKPDSDKKLSNFQDVVRKKSTRVSKVLQRQSTLPSVPEEFSVEGNGQLSGDSIFKKSEIKSGWMIPKESKPRVSLKRKSSVPLTVTKRSKVSKNKDSEVAENQDDESLFENPGIPNLVEVSSLQKKRETYLVKKKQETTENEKECLESVTDGIIPLEILGQKRSVVSTNGETTKENSRDRSKISISKNSLKDKNEKKQNFSTNDKVYGSEKKLTKEVESSVSGHVKPSNKMVNLNDTKQTEQNHVDAKGKNLKRKQTKSSVKKSNVSEEVNNELLQNITGSRKLRERKPNVQYTESFENKYNNTKEIKKNKRESTLKASKKKEENLKETQVEIKTQRKKTVKRNIIESDEIQFFSGPDLQNPSEKHTEELSSNKKDLNLEIKVDKKKTDRSVKPKVIKAIKKVSENIDITKKGKKFIKLNCENSVEKEENPTSHTTLETCTITKTKPQKKNQTSLGVDNGNDTDKYQPIKASGENTISGQHNKEDEENEQNVEKKKGTRRKTTSRKRDSKIQSIPNPENGSAKSVGLNRLNDRESCPETNDVAPTSGKNPVSEETECGISHSDYSVKMCRHDDSMKNNKHAARGFIIKELFGNNELSTEEVQPGVMSVPSVHINGFVKMGEVRLEPGACLSKISTNTAFTVTEGTAQVTIKKRTQSFNASDEHRRFFIPKSIDVSITNHGSQMLRMEFVKFRG